MKLRFIIGAGAASALVALLLSASAASATVFCEENKAPCPETQRWKEGTALDFITGELFTFSLPDGTVYEACQTTLLTTIRKTGSATSTVISENNKVSWFSCTTGAPDTLTTGELEFHAIEGTSNATVTVKNLKLQLTGSLVTCTMTSGSSAISGPSHRAGPAMPNST